jgi:hypothetical protein
MWRRVDIVWTDVSEELIAYIFRVEKSASEESVWGGRWPIYIKVVYLTHNMFRPLMGHHQMLNLYLICIHIVGMFSVLIFNLLQKPQS